MWVSAEDDIYTCMNHRSMFFQLVLELIIEQLPTMLYSWVVRTVQYMVATHVHLNCN